MTHGSGWVALARLSKSFLNTGRRLSTATGFATNAKVRTPAVSLILHFEAYNASNWILPRATPSSQRSKRPDVERATHKKSGLQCKLAFYFFKISCMITLHRFMTNIRGAKCLAVDSRGNKCPGGPVLKAKREVCGPKHQSLRR